MSITKQIDLYGSITPDAVAYRNHSPFHKEESLTFGQLKTFSDRLAAYLQNNFPDDKRPIVVYGHKSHDMPVCFLACVKAGHPYCPVDISTPPERLLAILKETDTPVILAAEALDIHWKMLTSEEIQGIIKTEKNLPDLSRSVSGEDLFYVLFTSGSSGTPKGVMITENCLLHFLDWAVTLGDRNLKERKLVFLNQALFSFDLSVMDFYLSLYCGGTVWCLDKEVQADFSALMDSLRQSSASVWVSTPSFANYCLADPTFGSGIMPELELFLFCGETLSNFTVKSLHHRFPNSTVVNTYGPTESTVAVTGVLVTPELCARYNPLPVGKPKSGTFLFILDRNGKQLPEGSTGEIEIAGNSVGAGYCNQPELTARSFSVREIKGKALRSYKTGDIGTIRDGQLFYCGRMDLQIKLHGYRIEIEDVENNLLKLPGIKSAVVIPYGKNGAAQSLAAFVMTGYRVENRLEETQFLRRKLAEFLPLYMIPKKIIFLDSIPLTVNGKADRKKLRAFLEKQ